MLKPVVLGSWVLLCVYMLSAWTSAPQEENRIEQMVNALKSEKAEERDSAKNEILTDRRKMITMLVDIVALNSADRLQWAEAHTATNLSMRILGEMRATDAIDVLIPNITKTTGDGPTTTVSYASDALIKIGVPATPKLVKHIGSSDDGGTIKATAQILGNIYGHDIGKVVLEKEMAKETDRTKKARIQKAIDLIEEERRKEE